MYSGKSLPNNALLHTSRKLTNQEVQNIKASSIQKLVDFDVSLGLCLCRRLKLLEFVGCFLFCHGRILGISERCLNFELSFRNS